MKTRDIKWESFPADIDSLGRFTQTRMKCLCPFCHTPVIAYVWSLSGSGKRCPGCRALLSHHAATTEKQRANARLIDAAPDLLSALEEARGWVQECVSIGLADRDDRSDVLCLEKVDAAIAKAKGETK